MTPIELYWKIKEKYPDWEPPAAKYEPEYNPTNENEWIEKRFNCEIRRLPPFTDDQIDLLDAGFDVKPNYDPRHYKSLKEAEDAWGVKLSDFDDLGDIGRALYE